MTEPAAPTAAPISTPIVATAGRYYRNARYIMVVGMLVMGGYFLYDGYVGYPKLNTQIEAVATQIDKTPAGTEDWVKLDKARTRLGSPKSDTTIGLQKVLGYALPVVAVGYLLFVLNKSRGEIRLAGDTLTAPGHPPVPLSAVTSVDQGSWKKKGIAAVKYDHAGKKGRIVLDDFVYQQVPVDAIYDRVLAATRPPAGGVTGAASEAAPDASV